MAEKILVVDDGKNICEILEFNLSNEGYEVECAYSAEEALEKLTPGHSLILLDVMMGGMSGYKMAEKLRKEENPVPIIFLTAKDTENDMLTGFSVGGDDYISKPFSIKEVIARVKAVLKRTETRQKKQESGPNIEKAENKLVFNDLTIDFDTKELIIGEEIVPLTRTEFEIITLLASNSSRVFEREDIIDLIWKDAPYITERTIDVHIGRLRKKLGDKASIITSRPGYGYRFNDSGK
ncbi:MAG: response regulator transcription factor [Dysgonamonadaceae bacterium]|jgi:DNA-binding response OmpR family regulator|nr:response regulator transcription factor [Dysgonamonadaceae bacterium]